MLGRLAGLGVTMGVLAGCAAGGAGVSGKSLPSCVVALTVSPETASADHQATPPGNQVKYQAAYGPTAESSCKFPTVMVKNATWTSSDPTDVQVSSAPGDTNGLATCTGATSGAATLTASYTPTGAAAVAGTATITCK